MRFDKVMKVFLVGSILTLYGCANGNGNVDYISPLGYSHLADYLSDTFERANCIGVIFSNQGKKSINADGLKYELNGRNIKCYVTSIEESISRYCASKGGQMIQGNSWCQVNKEPLFNINYGSDTSRRVWGVSSEPFSSVEQSNLQTRQQWLDSAERLGFISERVQQRIDLDKEISLEKDKAENERKKIEMNAEVNTQIGDLICKEDYDADPYRYPSKPYYKAYVEKKVGDKTQLRLVWHGGDGFVINDINENNKIVWVSPKGWKHCE